MSIKKIIFYPLCLENYWKENVKGDTLQIFIFEQNDFKNSPNTLEQMIEKKLYLREVKITRQQLVNNGCKIVIE